MGGAGLVAWFGVNEKYANYLGVFLGLGVEGIGEDMGRTGKSYVSGVSVGARTKKVVSDTSR